MTSIATSLKHQFYVHYLNIILITLSLRLKPHTFESTDICNEEKVNSIYRAIKYTPLKKQNKFFYQIY